MKPGAASKDSGAAQQARNTDAEHKACAVRLRAERRAGEMLAGMEKNRGAEGVGSNQYEVRFRDETAPAPTLADMGITKGQSSRWQQLASVPEADFERVLADPDAMPSRGALTSAAPVCN